jgi:putative ABC transport system substrate-binding protein
MDRRAFLVALFIAGGCGKREQPSDATPGKAGQTRIPRVAILVFGTRGVATATAPSSAASLVRGRLSELGYVDGRTILFEEHYADGDHQRMAELAREAVERRPDVVVAIPATATLAARRATSTIPIVMAHAGDPVGTGLVASLSHPGGNVTGTTSMAPELGRKQIDILRELIPGLRNLGVLVNPTNPGTPQTRANLEEAARLFNIRIVVAEVARADDFDIALRRLGDARLDALFVMVEPMVFLNRTRVLDFVRAQRLPTSFDVGAEIVRQGGLISYGPVLAGHYAVVAEYVDKILRGANPGDLPVHQPTQFALAVNLKTARELGIIVPQSLLVRADEVIQ